MPFSVRCRLSRSRPTSRLTLLHASLQWLPLLNLSDKILLVNQPEQLLYGKLSLDVIIC